MSGFFAAPMMLAVCTMNQLSVVKCGAKLFTETPSTPPATRVPNRIGSVPSKVHANCFLPNDVPHSGNKALSSEAIRPLPWWLPWDRNRWERQILSVLKRPS